MFLAFFIIDLFKERVRKMFNRFHCDTLKRELPLFACVAFKIRCRGDLLCMLVVWKKLKIARSCFSDHSYTMAKVWKRYLMKLTETIVFKADSQTSQVRLNKTYVGKCFVAKWLSSKQSCSSLLEAMLTAYLGKNFEARNTLRPFDLSHFDHLTFAMAFCANQKKFFKFPCA